MLTDLLASTNHETNHAANVLTWLTRASNGGADFLREPEEMVSSYDKLPALIDTLISAVRAGELDDLFGRLPRTERSARPARRLDAPAPGGETASPPGKF
jgi:hypothetical protein